MPETVRVGDHHANRAELWLPAGADEPRPVVVLIHGGYWRARSTMRLMHRLAEATVGCGGAAWHIEYRRTGLLGGGGGWPATFEDVALAVDHLTEVPAVDLGVPQVLIHGLADATVPPSMSERYVARAAAAGDDATYVPVDAVDHMDVIDPDSAAWAPTCEALARLL